MKYQFTLALIFANAFKVVAQNASSEKSSVPLIKVEYINLFTYIFVGFIIACFIWACVYIYRSRNKGELKNRQRWIEFLPSAISSLGVLGTFAGITIGLWYFKEDALDVSIPFLLGGLKTAFFTSLAGMIGSMILGRMVNSFYDELDRNTPSSSDEAIKEICTAIQSSSNDSTAAIQKMESAMTQAMNRQTVLFNTLNTNIQSLSTVLSKIDEKAEAIQQMATAEATAAQSIEQKIETQNASITAQTAAIKAQTAILTRLENTAGDLLESSNAQAGIAQEALDETHKFSTIMRGYIDEIEDEMTKTNSLLTEKFDEFAQLLKESNTKALKEAMENLVVEFQTQMNALISRLVQENFEQLNQSVQNLNTWQQENKQMIAELTTQYKTMADNFARTDVTLSNVSDNTRELVGNGGRLQTLIDDLRRVMIDDEKFVQIATNLSQSADLTRSNMEKFDESTNKLNEWVRKQRDFRDAVNELIVKLEELNSIRDYGETFWRETKEKMDEGVGIISDGSRQLNSQIHDINQEFYNRLSATLANLDACIQAMIDHKA